MSKLTREDKIEIYERRKKGETISSLVKTFNICESNIKYLITLIEKYGNNILRKDKNRVYCEYKEFKGVDVPSFTVVLEDEGVVVKDKNRIYENDCECQVKIILIYILVRLL